jgi:hypothetical protein
MPKLFAESNATTSGALSALFVFISHSLGLTAQAEILSALRAFPMQNSENRLQSPTASNFAHPPRRKRFVNNPGCELGV